MVVCGVPSMPGLMCGLMSPVSSLARPRSVIGPAVRPGPAMSLFMSRTGGSKKDEAKYRKEVRGRILLCWIQTADRRNSTRFSQT